MNVILDNKIVSSIFSAFVQTYSLIKAYEIFKKNDISVAQ